MVPDSPRLLLDICQEGVIDRCADQLYTWQSGRVAFPGWLNPQAEVYETLKACSLTCRDWLYRSRHHIYSVVVFRRYDHVASFLATVDAQPFLADHTRVLWIQVAHHYGHMRQVKLPPGLDGYIPFARKDLVQRLRNVRTLILDVPWNRYPPGYHHSAGRYPITDLYLINEFPSPTSLFPLLRSFRNLDRLHMLPHGWHLDRSEPPHHDPWEKFSLTPKQQKWRIQLKLLDLGSGLTQKPNFPPKGALPASVEELALEWNPESLLDRDLQEDALLMFLAELRSLRKLTLIVQSFYWTETTIRSLSNWITAALTQTQKEGSLNTITLRLFPVSGTSPRRSSPGSLQGWIRPCTTPLPAMFPYSYSVPPHEYDYWEELLSPALREAMYGLPNLRQLHVIFASWPHRVTFFDEPADYARWKDDIQQSLPLLRAKVSVTLNRMLP
ncbi:hypothetical protein BV20DRAFT_975369 [Pilatotrama ljubarskyi]|nr:hypothetical protein BV20DRAFT_975369 [Pilatotrama ljubarskyi]